MNERNRLADSPQAIPTEEFVNLRFRLRHDLDFSLQSYGGVPCYVVEDSVNSVYFRIGEREYAFMSLLNGKQTITEVVSLLSSTRTGSSITEDEAYAICRWLADNQLVHCSQGFSSEIQDKQQITSQRQVVQQVLNPLSLSLTLGNPASALRWLHPFFGWLYRPVGLAVWMLVLMVGCLRFLVDQDRILSNAGAVISSNNWLWLILAAAVCKIAHEISHGLCSLTYGGTVKSFGFNFVMFFPMPFVDASSIWRLPSKWQRIHVAFAGVYAELLLAATAAIVHSYTDNDLARMICLNVMLTGGLLTLLVNLNPLLRYDGYYMLSDFAEFPNLGSVSTEYVQSWFKWILCGVWKQSTFSAVTKMALLTYGSLSGLCRISIAIAMVLAAQKLFAGAGFVFAMTASIAWFVLPMLRGARYVVWGAVNEVPSRIRFASILVIAGLAGWIGGTTIYLPETLQLSGVVDFVPAETVRCQIDGFVSRIEVTSGEFVRKGDTLLELSNPNIHYDLDALEIELKQLTCRRQSLQSAGDIASIHAVDGTIQSLRTKQLQKKGQLNSLTIHAPCDGVVIASDIKNLPGKFLTSGDVVCVIGDPNKLGIRLMIPQDDVDELSEVNGRIGEMRIEGAWEEVHKGLLVSVEPRTTLELIHPALAATSGGPMAVRQSTATSDAESIMLADPHFVGTAEIPLNLRTLCASGQLVDYSFECRRHTVLQKAWSYFSHSTK